MEAWLNAMRAQAGAMANLPGQLRCGVVQSLDTKTYCAKVMLQPEGVLTGWLPITSPWVGDGWGLVAPPVPGQQVMVAAQEGRAEHGIILGGLFSNEARAPAAAAGEAWLVHRSGSFLTFRNDGSIEAQATLWRLTGTLSVSGDLLVGGDIADRNGGRGTLNSLRTIYDAHVHPGVQSGPAETGLPIPQA
ncbi:hypothetical protein Acid7E03_09640 [Acidisoma sp. 7E03]